MKGDDILVLNQVVKSLEEAEAKLEDAYEKKDFENFEKIKRFMAGMQLKISEMLK